MPEGPEVETVVRGLAPHITGRTIAAVTANAKRVARGKLERAAGQRVERVYRQGKFIVMALERGYLVVHLGMTGKLLVDAQPGAHTRASIELDTCRVLFDDSRMFGKVEYSDHVPERVAALGPDPLAITVDEFLSRIRTRRGHIKPLLLNQKFLAGIGNIYADESLFQAGIRPRAKVERVGPARLRALFTAIQGVLSEAIAHRGSSISDYVDPNGEPGDFHLLHRVYGREGAPCTVCGTPIRKIVLAQRGTHFCPRCQK